MRDDLRGVLVAAVGVLVAVGLSSPGAEAADIGEADLATIVVRTYTPPHLRGEIRTARRTASAILGHARIQVDWLECGLPAAVSESVNCSQPLQSTELVVRIVSATPVGVAPGLDTLGFAFVDLDTGGGSLATIYADRVGVMALGAGIGVAELLGRTIAHEIGHLLLGTNRHAPHGLMRASWTSADLRQNRAIHWLFDGKEGESMRRAITFRRMAPGLTKTLRVSDIRSHDLRTADDRLENSMQ
jgi:hypothetical protein